MAIYLTNITIYKRQTTQKQTYFVIYDKENTSKSYFCFQNKLKEGWNDLVNNYQNLEEVELEIEEGEKGTKVIKLLVVKEKGDIIFA